MGTGLNPQNPRVSRLFFFFSSFFIIYHFSFDEMQMGIKSINQYAYRSGKRRKRRQHSRLDVSY